MTFTTQEIEYLKQNWDKLSSYVLARTLGRKQGTISRKLRKLGLISSKAKKISESRSLHLINKHRCLDCHTIFIRDEQHFYRCNNSFQPLCKTCAINSSKRTYYQNHDSLEQAIKYKLNKTKRFHRNKNFTYLTEQDVMSLWRAQQGKCYYTSEPMTFKANFDNSFSLDRKDPNKGYNRDNVVLCCRIINYMKQSLSVSDFRLWTSKVKTAEEQVVDYQPLTNVPNVSP